MQMKSWLRNIVRNPMVLGLLGIVTVVLFSWAPSWAQMPTGSRPALTSTSPKLTVVTNPGQLNLPADSKPFVPSGMATSKEPSATRGVICELGQSSDECDDRVPMISRDNPWSTIGRLEGITTTGDQYHCTGVLIAEDIVLTNAHCVVDPKTHKPALAMQFLPNLVNGVLQSRADVTQVVNAYADTDFADCGNTCVPHPRDWAIVQLNKPIGQKYGYLGWKTLPSEVLAKNPGRFIMAGYSGDFPDPNRKPYQDLGLTAGRGLTAGVHEGCSILKEENNVLFHNCDTTGGSSGGPILAIINGGYYVVALNSAERVKETASGERQGIVNFATKLDRLTALVNARS